MSEKTTVPESFCPLDIFAIEPSAIGSAKIVRAIWRIVADHDFRKKLEEAGTG